MSQLHFPDAFGHTPKPHIQKMNGEWVVCWPTNWPLPDPAQSPLAPFLRRLNGIVERQPSSFVVNLYDPVRVQ